MSPNEEKRFATLSLLIFALLSHLAGAAEPPPTALVGRLSVTFTNPTPERGDVFGIPVVAVGTDKVFIGAHLDDTGAPDAGGAYLFSTNGTLLTTFTNPMPALRDYFGFRLASVGADKVVIGAYEDGPVATGAAYLFNTNGSLLTTLTNPIPWGGDFFGIAVAGVSTDKVLIGAASHDGGNTLTGAAFLFNTNGTLLTTFTNPAPSIAPDGFAYALAPFGNDRVLIGASQEDTGAFDAGVAYLFSTNGDLLTTFTNPTPASSDYFGSGVAAVGDDLVLIGAPHDKTGAHQAGAAYLFTTNGTLVTTFTNPTPADYEFFGSAVTAVGADKVLIGAPGDNRVGEVEGAVYLFSIDGTLLAAISSPPSPSRGTFGASLAVLGSDTFVISSHQDDAGADDAGAAQMFKLESVTVPSLRIEPLVNGSVRVLWPLPASGFVLDRTTEFHVLPDRTDWVPVSMPYQTNATHIFVTVPAVDKTFYRLRHP